MRSDKCAPLVVARKNMVPSCCCCYDEACWTRALPLLGRVEQTGKCFGNAREFLLSLARLPQDLSATTEKKENYCGAKVMPLTTVRLFLWVVGLVVVGS